MAISISLNEKDSTLNARNSRGEIASVKCCPYILLLDHRDETKKKSGRPIIPHKLQWRIYGKGPYQKLMVGALQWYKIFILVDTQNKFHSVVCKSRKKKSLSDFSFYDGPLIYFVGHWEQYFREEGDVSRRLLNPPLITCPGQMG